MTSATTTVAAPGGAFSLKPLLFTAGVGSLSMMAFVAVVGPMARLLGLQPWHVGAAVTAVPPSSIRAKGSRVRVWCAATGMSPLPRVAVGGAGCILGRRTALPTRL